MCVAVVVVAVSITMTHKCSRDNCKTEHINGPKIKCLKCKSTCYLQCFGFIAGEKINGMDTVKCWIQDGSVFSTFLSTMIFSCCGTMTSTEQKSGLKMPSAAQRGPSKSRESKNECEETILNALADINKTLASIKTATDMNTAEIAEIKSLSSTTEANVKKVTEQNAMGTPGVGQAMTYAKAFRQQALERAAASGTPTGKRKRVNNSPQREKPKFPTPKMGTKSNVGGLSAIPQRARKIDEKPKFEKAIWISRLSPDTTEDQIIDYIVNNTAVTDRTKMNVHKLVKKGVEMSSLNFVSFKVELNIADFDVLNDPEVWPQHVLVREFSQAPKITLGDHLFPAMNRPNEHQSSSSDPLAMDFQ